MAVFVASEVSVSEVILIVLFKLLRRQLETRTVKNRLVRILICFAENWIKYGCVDAQSYTLLF